MPRVQQEFHEVEEWPDVEPVDLSICFNGLPEDHRLRRYFGFGQNDAFVISGSFQNDHISLTINHYDVWRLACFAGLADWHKCDDAFPITLRFSGVKEFYPLRIVEHGDWQMIQKSRRCVFDNFVDVGNFEMCAFSADEVVALMYFNGGECYKRKRKLKEGWYNNEYKLCIHARKIDLEEHYREGWIKYCGEDSLPLLDKFESVWPVPAWGEPEFLEWIEKSR